MNKRIISTALLMFLGLFTACSSSSFKKTVENVDLNKFAKKWYVIAGRFTFVENGAHNAVEEYKLNIPEDRIDIDFSFHKDSFDGVLKKYPQKGWVKNKNTNAHWKISPFWPLKFDYLVIALADDYSWTAIGVPNTKYLWIMADHWNVTDPELKEILSKVEETGYPIQDIIRLPQKW